MPLKTWYEQTRRKSSKDSCDSCYASRVAQEAKGKLKRGPTHLTFWHCRTTKTPWCVSVGLAWRHRESSVWSNSIDETTAEKIKLMQRQPKKLEQYNFRIYKREKSKIRPHFRGASETFYCKRKNGFNRDNLSLRFTMVWCFRMEETCKQLTTLQKEIEGKQGVTVTCIGFITNRLARTEEDFTTFMFQ